MDWTKRILCVLSLLLLTSPVYALPVTDNATTMVDLGACGSLGPAPFGLSGACDNSDVNHQAVSSAEASLGNVISVGNAHVEGEASSTQVFFPSTNFASADVNFSFSQNLGVLGLPPFNLTMFPILFAAYGEVSVSSSGTDGVNGAVGGAAAGAGIYGVAHYAAQYLGQNGSDSFNAVQTFWLPEGIYLGYVHVDGAVTGACPQKVGTDPSACYPSSASFSATVDPVIKFDQAAFDAQYGSNSFQLDEYYTLTFNPNIPTTPSQNVPEPSTLLLFGTGIASVGLLRKRLLR